MSPTIAQLALQCVARYQARSGTLDQTLTELAQLIGGLGASENSDLFDILFGLGGEGNVTFAPGLHTYSGLHDVESIRVPAGVTLSPNAEEILVIRSRTSIIWDGDFVANGVFSLPGTLISIGSVVQGPGGGGAGGGKNNNGTVGDGGQQSPQNDGGGGSICYGSPTQGSGGSGGPPGGNGVSGTPAAPGTISTYQQMLLFNQFPDALAAVTSTSPGFPGTQGGPGGRGQSGTGGPGGNSDNFGQGGQGGPGGGILILIAPSVILTGSFTMKGSAGTPGMGTAVTLKGGDAPPGSGGGGGGGGGAGSGGQGGNGGVLLAFYRTLQNTAAMTLTAGGTSLGGIGGSPGLGDTFLVLPFPPTDGAIGGDGAPGCAGGAGFFYAHKILT